MKTKQAYLIDPFARDITVINVPAKQGVAFLHQLHALIGTDIVERVQIGHSTLWVDENGLLRDQAKQAFFGIDRFPQGLAGKAVLCGIDKVPLAWLRSRVVWLELRGHRMVMA